VQAGSLTLEANDFGYAVRVGAGGSVPAAEMGNNGTNSFLHSVVALGGGAGGGANSNQQRYFDGNTLGSEGGSAGRWVSQGGEGAGSQAIGRLAGVGAASDIAGDSMLYGGGGFGATSALTAGFDAVNNGGGGAGGNSNISLAAGNGVNGLGGGGGGVFNGGGGAAGGRGGSGVVMGRYDVLANENELLNWLQAIENTSSSGDRLVAQDLAKYLNQIETAAVGNLDWAWTTNQIASAIVL
jgi:hypothetical protein